MPDNTLPSAVQTWLNWSICRLGCGLRRAEGSTSSIAFARWRQCALTGGQIGARRRIQLNHPFAAAMWPYVKLLWPLVIIKSPDINSWWEKHGSKQHTQLTGYGSHQGDPGSFVTTTHVKSLPMPHTTANTAPAFQKISPSRWASPSYHMEECIRFKTGFLHQDNLIQVTYSDLPIKSPSIIMIPWWLV